MSSFQGADFYNISSLLSDEEKAIQQSVRSFVDKEIMPVIAENYINHHFPKDLFLKLGELGVLGANLEGYDCAGLGEVSYGLIMQELERGDSGIRSAVSVQGALCMFPIHAYASEELKQKYLPAMARGELIGCFGLTEPDFGSNPSGMQTRAKKVGSTYVLNGNKMWITNGGIADLAIIWAKLEDEDNKVGGFIVPTNTKGMTIHNIEKKFSLNASITSEINMDQCVVPADHMLQVRGLKGPFSCLNHARYGIAWGALGAAMACFEEARDYAKTRIQFDKPIASFQLVQSKLTYMLTEITKGQLLVYQLGRLKEQNNYIPQQISMAKMNNVSKALEIARLARDILGASGITLEYNIGRHLMNLESVNTYEGTEDIHRLIIGEHITGIPAYQ
ncbi:MAG: acyl-CoA dehydrogenase family protein [Bdellovibrionaceae bacterium]|nr:acyl-CoA dehydrogenase family protein [Pseudobdellovibrionaceae bacterium]